MIEQGFWAALSAVPFLLLAFAVLKLQKRVRRLEMALVALAEDVGTQGAWEAALKLVPPGVELEEVTDKNV